MKKFLALLLSLVMVLALVACGDKKDDTNTDDQDNNEVTDFKVGFIMLHDENSTYDLNFINAAKEACETLGVEYTIVTNVPEGQECYDKAAELADAGCNIIFADSFGHEDYMIQAAKDFPDVQFCHSTGTKAHTEGLSNYHNAFASIYEGRYLAGIAAGMKLNAMIEAGEFKPEEAKIGYVGAFTYAEVISGYTAFLLGVHSIVPDVVMSVRYTNNWNDYLTEKKYAKEFIDEGCVIISQHSDTTGPATACEATDSDTPVYIVSYNESMANVAPTTYLTGCKINWEPYVTGAVESVLKDKKIEENVKGNVVGNDMGAGFEEGWVEMLELNELVAAKGTKAKMQEVINGFKKGKIQVFQGDYIGVSPEDPKDTCNLKKGYIENENSSAPTFHYVLKDVITVEE